MNTQLLIFMRLRICDTGIWHVTNWFIIIIYYYYALIARTVWAHLAHGNKSQENNRGSRAAVKD